MITLTEMTANANAVMDMMASIENPDMIDSSVGVLAHMLRDLTGLLAAAMPSLAAPAPSPAAWAVERDCSQEAQAAPARVRDLENEHFLLVHYGQHKSRCEIAESGACTCGFTDALAETATLARARAQAVTAQPVAVTEGDLEGAYAIGACYYAAGEFHFEDGTPNPVAGWYGWIENLYDPDLFLDTPHPTPELAFAEAAHLVRTRAHAAQQPEPEPAAPSFYRRDAQTGEPLPVRSGGYDDRADRGDDRADQEVD